MVAACCVVRSLRSLAPERISPVAVFSVREVWRRPVIVAVSRLANHVEVVAQLPEGALEVALDPAGKVGMGKGAEHRDALAKPLLHRLDEVVDAAGKAVELRIVEVGGDAAGEVARDRGIDHVAKAGQQRLHHPGALVPALFRAQPFVLGHLAHARCVLAEHFDRPRHRAELVAAIAPFDLGVEVALRQLVHRTGEPGDRPRDRLREEVAEARRDDQHARRLWR